MCMCVGVIANASVKKSVPLPGSEMKKTTAPVFLKELHDLKVMDGSQVTMTVEVTGKSIFLHYSLPLVLYPSYN